MCITGAGSRLEKEAAFAIARRGHRVIATVLYEEQIKDILKVKEQEKLNIEVIKTDITNEQDRKKLV